MTSRVYFFLISLTAFLLTSCVAATDYSVLRNDLNNLQSESFQQKNLLNDIQNRLAAIEVQNKGASAGALRQSQERLNSQVSQLIKEVQIIRGALDEGNYGFERRLEEARTDRDILRAQADSMDNQLKDFGMRLLRIESALISKGVITAQAPPELPMESVKKELPEVSESKESMDALYKEAYELFKSGEYKDSRNKFKAIIGKFREGELLDNSYFWLAETYYKEGLFEDAIISYETLVKNFPKSDKVPGALLKQAYSFLELPDRRTAEAILEQLVERFPDSKEAELAKKKLELLKSEANRRV